MKVLTVGELKRALDGVSDEVIVQLSSDSGVDQGEGAIVVESANHVKYGNTEYFSIYANDYDCEEIEVE